MIITLSNEDMEELQNEKIVEQDIEDRRWCVYMHTNKENGKVTYKRIDTEFKIIKN